MVADRAAPLLRPTENVTVPVGPPDAPPVMTSHGALLVAVYVQPASVVTVKLPVPPVTGSEVPVAVPSVSVQVPACVMVMFCPATVTVAERGAPVFAATVKFTVLEPEPLNGLAEIQVGRPVIVQVQPAPVVIWN